MGKWEIRLEEGELITHSVVREGFSEEMTSDRDLK